MVATFLDTIESQGKRLARMEQTLSDPSVIGSTPASPTFTSVTVDDGAGNVVYILAPSSPPTGLTVTTGAYLSNLYADIAWVAPVDGTAKSYEVQVAKKISSVYQIAQVFRSYTNTIRVEGLDPLATYGIKVYSVNTVGKISTPLPSSGYTDFTTTVDTTIPAAPTGVSVSQGVASVTLKWNENTEADVKGGAGLYEFDYSTDNTFVTGVTTKRVSATIVSINGLTVGPTWYFRVRAIDSSGNASASSTAVSTAVGVLPSDGSAPPAVGAVTVTSMIGALFVKWAEVTTSDLVSYDVHLSTSSGFTPSGGTLAGTVTDSTAFVIRALPGSGTALAYGTVYYLKVIARDVDGSAAASTQVTGTISQALNADIGLLGGGNIVPNSTFSAWNSGVTAPNSWSKGSDVTQSRVTGRAGGFALQFQTATLQGNVSGARVSTANMAQLTVSTEIVVTVYARRMSGAGNLMAAIDSTGSFTWTPTVGNTVWARYTWVVTSGASSATILNFMPGTAADVWEIDDVQLEIGQIATAFAPKPDEVLAGTITATEILDASITTAKIGANQITAAVILAGTITATEIFGGTITASKMATGTITAASGIIGDLSASVITTGTLAAGRIAAKSLSAEKLSIGALSGNMLPNGSFEDVQAADATKPALWGWNVGLGTGGAWAYNATGGNGGGGCLQLTIGSAGFPRVYSEAVPVTPGQTWYFSVWNKASAASGNNTVYLWYGQTPNFNVGDSGTLDGSFLTYGVPPTSYNILEASWAIPAGYGYMRVGLAISGAAPGTVASFDDCNLKIQETGTTIKDGVINTAKIVSGGLDAAVITFGSMSGSRITTNTLSAAAITTSTLTAANITIAGGSLRVGDPLSGWQTGILIDSGGIKGYSVGNLMFDLTAGGTLSLSGSISASTITGTAITGGTITGGAITGGTITGALIKTAASGQRTELSSTTIDFYSGIPYETTYGYPGSIYNYGANSGTASYVESRWDPGSAGGGSTGQPHIYMRSRTYASALNGQLSIDSGDFLDINVDDWTSFSMGGRLYLGTYEWDPRGYLQGDGGGSGTSTFWSLYVAGGTYSISAGATLGVSWTYTATKAGGRAWCDHNTGADSYSHLTGTSSTAVSMEIKNVSGSSISPGWYVYGARWN